MIVIKLKNICDKDMKKTKITPKVCIILYLGKNRVL